MAYIIRSWIVVAVIHWFDQQGEAGPQRIYLAPWKAVFRKKGNFTVCKDCYPMCVTEYIWKMKLLKQHIIKAQSSSPHFVYKVTQFMEWHLSLRTYISSIH